MKRVILLSALLTVGLAGAAMAEVKVQNKDDKAHDLSIKCGSGSTLKRSIQPGTISGVGTGPCTITVDGGGGGTVGDGETYVIPKS